MRRKKIAFLNLPLVPEAEISLFSGISRFTRENESWEFVFNCEAYPAAIKLLEKIQWDGAIVRITDRRTREHIKRLKKPVVNVSSWIEEAHIPTVRREERMSGAAAAQHLLAKGVTRFGFIRRRGDAWFHSERYQGFVETLQRARFRCDVYQQKEPLKEKKEMQRFQTWVKSLRPPLGLFLSDDVGAQNVIDVCHDVGLLIPRDIALIGSMNQPDVVYHTDPPLTCVNPDEETVGYVAAKLLSKLMQGEQVDPHAIDIPPLPVIERESTQIVGIDDEVIRRAVEFVLSKFTHPLSILDIAEHLSISRATFYRRFLKAVGETPHDYIQKIRVDKAKELLQADESVPLEDVAVACGFTSRKHLNESFIRLVSESPSQWRSKHAIKDKKEIRLRR